MNADLLKKYNVAAPRYTSYPTVPYWDTTNFDQDTWFLALKQAYMLHGKEGMSIYIHLPFCESLCTYCGCNTRITKNHGVEKPYIDALIREWEMYTTLLGEQPKIKEIHLGGGTPTFFSPENLARLMDAFTTHSQEEMECSFEGHPDNTTPAHLEVLYDAGFRRLSLGIQDFDKSVQKMINRYQTPLQVAEITELARKKGYHSVNFDLIYGLPGQTFAGLQQTLQEVVAMKPDRVAFYSYAHVPWMKPGQRHFTEKDLPQGNEKFELYRLGRETLSEAGYQEIGMDHFALPSDPLALAVKKEELHRNFMGYTHQRTALLLGLGVSSISDCSYAFAQNVKTVEQYLQKIQQGEFALEKGHLLNEEDLEIRRHILNLMCKNRTDFLNNYIPESITRRLAPLAEDGLVDMDQGRISVHETGRSFLRNICMALDERLWERQPETALFSQTL